MLETVFIIEDQPSKFELLKGFVKHEYSVDVTWSKNFRSARNLLQSQSFDLILLDMSFDDYGMPYDETNFAGLAGLHVLQYMLRRRILTPVIICTAHNSFSDPTFESIEGVENLDEYTTKYFGGICKGCVKISADSELWQSELRKLISNVN